MKKFIAIYHTPEAAKAQMANVTPEQYGEMMKLWGAWGERCGENLVEMGAPVMGGHSLDASGNWTSGNQEIGGYSIVQGKDADAVKALFVGHPHLSVGIPGAKVEIHEFIPM